MKTQPTFQEYSYPEDHPIYRAIDRGGGQTCDVAGVIRELASAGYAIIPVAVLKEFVELHR